MDIRTAPVWTGPTAPRRGVTADLRVRGMGMTGDGASARVGAASSAV